MHHEGNNAQALPKRRNSSILLDPDVPEGYTVYLAGPMRGLPNYNWPMFIHGARLLRNRGITVVSPAEMDEAAGYVDIEYTCGCSMQLGNLVTKGCRGGDGLQVERVTLTSSFDIDKVLAQDLRAIETVDELVLLPGWRASSGCAVEVDHAMALGIPVSELRFQDVTLGTRGIEVLLGEALRRPDHSISGAGRQMAYMWRCAKVSRRLRAKSWTLQADGSIVNLNTAVGYKAPHTPKPPVARITITDVPDMTRVQSVTVNGEPFYPPPLKPRPTEPPATYVTRVQSVTVNGETFLPESPKPRPTGQPVEGVPNDTQRLYLFRDDDGTLRSPRWMPKQPIPKERGDEAVVVQEFPVTQVPGAPAASDTPPAPDTDDTEVMVTDPLTGGQKGQKLARFDLIPPDTMNEVAKHFGRGALKHADRNWERGYAWGLSYAALNRHLTAWWGGEDIDKNTGGHHLDAVTVHALFLRTFVLRGIGTDDRSKP